MTMQPLLITTTEDGTGKTAIALALGQLAQERNHTVGYMKPKGTRLESHLGKTIDRDATFAATVLNLEQPMDVIEPIIYSSTFIQGVLRGHDDPSELRTNVLEHAQAIGVDSDFFVVEGGGHLDIGAIIGLSDPELADLLDARVLLATRYQEPGDVDITLSAARRFGDRLTGVVFNAISDTEVDALEADVIAYLERQGVPVLGVIPRRRDLAGVTVDQLAEELGGELLVEAGMDSLVERFLIGAMGGEAAIGHLRRTRAAAVITGGDRADIQSVAIEAPGVQCLVLTGGYRPSEAILGSASSAGVPVLLVGTDTRTTVDRAESIVRSGRTRDRHTIEVMRELLVQHADVDTLLDLDHPADDGE